MKQFFQRGLWIAVFFAFPLLFGKVPDKEFFAFTRKLNAVERSFFVAAKFSNGDEYYRAVASQISDLCVAADKIERNLSPEQMKVLNGAEFRLIRLTVSARKIMVQFNNIPQRVASNYTFGLYPTTVGEYLKTHQKDYRELKRNPHYSEIKLSSYESWLESQTSKNIHKIRRKSGKVAKNTDHNMRSRVAVFYQTVMEMRRTVMYLIQAEKLLKDSEAASME